MNAALIGLALLMGFQIARAEGLFAEGPLQVRPALIEGDDYSLVLINLRNADRRRQIKDVKVTVETASGPVFQPAVAVLEAGQQESLRAGATQSKKIQMWVHVVYDYNGLKNRLDKAVDVPQRGGSFSAWIALAPGLLGLAGVLAGGWLAHRFTVARERLKSAVDWQSTLFDKYERAYREFLNGWNAVASAQLLRAHLDTLRAKALVPPQLSRAGERTLRLLESDEKQQDKVAGCEQFRDQVVNYLLSRGLGT